MSASAIIATDLVYCYGRHVALGGITFELPEGGWLGLLGPNGSGKTTLFRLLSTLIPMQQGQLSVLGHDVARDPGRVRSRLGVTFQSPALDVRLTVRENLRCGGAIFGLFGTALKRRIEDLLHRFDLRDRQHSLVSELSGGLRRRVELAKCLLHEPAVLLLDEPTNGLDPRARQEFWETIRTDRDQRGTTIVVATHLMFEAELCGQLLLMDRGRIVGAGSPVDLQASLHGERLTIRCREPESLRQPLAEVLGCEVVRIGSQLTCRPQDPARQMTSVLERFGGQLLSIELSRPSLEDVFLERTGRTLEDSTEESVSPGESEAAATTTGAAAVEVQR
ncbi:MAG: ABC transporter ATP-binding protein [Planctomycetaceae bacterium]|nr:ABC transporter ATP-binding protein [Planctomycetaceae bacterium]